MKFSHILTEPDPNYLKLISSLNDISSNYKKFNHHSIKDFGSKRKIDDKLIEQRRIAKEKLKISDRNFNLLFNKINLNYYPKEEDEECGQDELRKIKEIESTYSALPIIGTRSRRVSTSFVHLISEVLYHDDFIEQLLIEINGDNSEPESENEDTTSSDGIGSSDIQNFPKRTKRTKE
ncbi:hypothetical protein BpHYR1_051747 [Brachionus plicatilis]|uniref:Uncharacterized protein n=1 Tax=Brachionus plicatilis TaxID=10195 RepID=A0A3M7QBF3_BRAPC|nr:hypothetical protein BpHYR1_051747 [Brachionus plicatilis]